MCGVGGGVERGVWRGGRGGDQSLGVGGIGLVAVLLIVLLVVRRMYKQF